MRSVKHREYEASVDDHGGSLFIRVLHVDDLVLAECSDAVLVERTAQALIDDYIETRIEMEKID